MSRDVFITFDVDWAPDWVCFEVSELLEKYQVPSTWFVTHPSDHVRYMLDRPHLYEVGIHPNFLPNSSHGSSFEAVFDYFRQFVPCARVMRTHSVFQSGPLLNFVARTTQILADSSILLRGCSGIYPFKLDFGGAPLTRLPFCWADDNEVYAYSPQWNSEAVLEAVGFRVLAFHPMHVVLNSRRPEQYTGLRGVTSNDVSQACRDQVQSFRHDGFGTHSFLSEVLARVACGDGMLVRPYAGIESAALS